MSRHQHTAKVYPSLSLGGNELNLIAEVRFTFLPAYPGRGPSYSDGGLPPEPASVEDREVVKLWVEGDRTLDGKGFDVKEVTPVPPWLATWIAENADEIRTS